MYRLDLKHRSHEASAVSDNEKPSFSELAA
jgi:hypothetical protein